MLDVVFYIIYILLLYRRSNIFTGFKQADEDAAQAKAFVSAHKEKLKFVKLEIVAFLQDIRLHLPDCEITEDMERDIVLKVTAAVEPLKKLLIVDQTGIYKLLSASLLKITILSN